ncbi:uncharacterized protein LOC122306248 [Carya illinoinensis]|uniref:uncharacterized protein LOC122306248 n=1 Tax=Carya illinoinensis TaxID=32201 RepID=UPI001C7196C8|nr:uncharacterized protein LOC122306248 [Carya illinoinensis]
MAVVTWRLWKRRNEVIFQNEFTSPLSLMKQVNQKLQDLKLLQHPTQIIPAMQEERVEPLQVWKAPPYGYYKINWDAAVDHKNQRVGIGVIIRDSDGQVIGTMRKNKFLNPDPHLAEACAALHAVLLGSNIGLRNIFLEGDALNVVNAINGVGEHWGQAGMVIVDIQEILNCFNSWFVAYSQRSTNQVAHVLARNALSIEGELIELEEIPSCIISMLQNPF